MLKWMQRPRFVACLVLLVMLLLAPAGMAQGASTWQIELLDAHYDVGTNVSMALDSEGRAHISYYDANHSTLKYIWFNGGGWQSDVLDTVGSYALGTSIAIDSDDRPHIAYHDSDDHSLKYAVLHGDDGWDIQTVAEGEDLGWYPSLALDSWDRPHIIYSEEHPDYGGVFDLEYTTLPVVGIPLWETKRLVDDKTISSHSLALDSEDHPHIAYSTRSNFGFEYLRRNDLEWLEDRIDDGVSVGDVSIALDSEDRPHVAYDDTVNDDLKHALYIGGSWRVEPVDTEARVGAYPSIAVDSQDLPHISYFDIENNAIKYATFSNTDGFVTEVVDPLGEPGVLRYDGQTALAIDSQDQIHVAYHDTNNHDLKYAKRIEDANVPPTVEANGPYSGGLGIPISLDGEVSDQDGDPLIIDWSYGIVSAPPGTTCTFADDGKIDTTITCDNYGSFTLTLTADDGTAAPVSDSASLNIVNVAPRVTLGGDVEIPEGDSFTASGSFSDPDQSDTHTATVDYGDGSGVQTLALNPDDTFNLSHAYPADDGQYDVEVCVTASDLGKGCATVSVTVYNADPTVSLGADVTIRAGDSFSVTGSYSDPGTNDTHTATVDYGDGSGVQSLDLNSTDKTFDLSHTYQTHGVYQVTVCVTDDDLGRGCDSLQVTVNGAPMADAGPSYAGEEGSAITLDGAAGDPDGDIVTTAWSYEVDSANAGVSCVFGDASELDTTFTCNDDGGFTLTLTVNDGFNLPVRDTATVTVSNGVPEITGVEATVSGAQATVTVDATDVGENDALSYALDCDNDTVYEMDAGETNSAICDFGAYEGTFQIGVQVSDDDGGVTTGAVPVTIVTSLCANMNSGILRYSDSCERQESALTIPGDEPVTVCVKRSNGMMRLTTDGSCVGKQTAYVLLDDGPLTVCVDRNSQQMRVVDDLGQCADQEFGRVIAATDVGEASPSSQLCADDYTGVLRYADDCRGHETAITIPGESPVTVCASTHNGLLRSPANDACAGHEISYELPEDGPLNICVSTFTQTMRAVDDLSQCAGHEFGQVIAATEVGVAPPSSR